MPWKKGSEALSEDLEIQYEAEAGPSGGEARCNCLPEPRPLLAPAARDEHCLRMASRKKPPQML
eukprot:CAMPEP_0197702194 /NCGR_PEP_ID=MMETSP1338-20131121/124213_1 /TAXON_ID=43686 ORGANISM="Pelagodinium beii, Strain RCC1491" /NCGR_SAMPLE_ID=MMETSP1338 /ASSEMBLY_ACC=CAM_ASM_000754 /LENGTH=63 /DNA_ID=CAMNT_0043285995 /DNA_START=71 /DNA_END=259 /DNA_ORIENTATION=-